MRFCKTLSMLCLAVIFTMTVSACAPTAQSEGTGGYIDDTVITTKVKAALLADKSIKSAQVSVETFKGRVQLSGFVNSRAEAEQAVRTARTVAGVIVVENDMQIR